MKICKAQDNRQYVAYSNDCSCLAFFMANQIGGKDIARIGNYSPTEGGSIVGDGSHMLDNMFGQTLREQAKPVIWNNGMVTYIPENFHSLLPSDLINVHYKFHPGIDIRSQCKALGLTAQKCDGGDPFVRCLVDSEFANYAEQHNGWISFGTYANATNQYAGAMSPSQSSTGEVDYSWQYRNIFRFADHENVFQKVEYFDGNSLFTMKFYKWNNVNGIYSLPFAPDTPGIWLNPRRAFSRELRLSTNIHTVCGNVDISFLENCGNLNELDWRILEPYSPSLIWECPDSKNLLYRNRFYEVLKICGIAKQHQIDLSIEKAVFDESKLEKAGVEEVFPAPVTKRQLLEEAEYWDIPVPESLIDDPYEISTGAPRFNPINMPFFWDTGDSVLFYGSGQEYLMQRLAKVLCSSLNFDKNVLLLIPDSDKFRMRQKITAVNCSHGLFMDSANILKEPKKLKRRILDHEISVVFFCMEQKQNVTDEIFQGLNLCRKHKVATAFFVNEKDYSALSSDLKTIQSESYEVVCDISDFVIDSGGKHIFRVSIYDSGTIDREEGNQRDMSEAKMRQVVH